MRLDEDVYVNIRRVGANRLQARREAHFAAAKFAPSPNLENCSRIGVIKDFLKTC